MSAILCIKNLEKSYKDSKAVDVISFEVQKGEILCILGPNGAGKSTTINMMTGALSCDGGEIHSTFSGGQDIHKELTKYKRRLGIVPQDLAIYEDLTAAQNVQFFASLYGMKGNELNQRSNYALEFVGLLDRARDKAKTFSGGMKRRLNIACAIAHNPDLLFMDEPTVGIDPQSRNHILDFIKRLRDEGKTIIYTTHYMEEVEVISTRIIILDHGKIIATGTSEELKENMDTEKMTLIEASELDSFDADELYGIEGVKHVENTGGRLEVTTIRNIENLDRIITILIEHGMKISSITTQVISLETVFLNLTGRSLRD
ncbi:MAG TPA: ABC transporter ATP-binding protein [Clostridiales bacterium]|nr:ABC transporter ATP-binding protein [Clostridiales bacterium]